MSHDRGVEREDEELRNIIKAKLLSMIEEARRCCRVEVEPGMDIVEGHELKEILESCRVVVAFFYTTTCPYCRALAPVFLEVAERYHEAAAFITVNLERHPYMSDAFNILGTPTVIIFVNRRPAARIVGLVDADRFEAAVRQALSMAGCPIYAS